MSMFSKAKTIAPAPKAKLEKKKQTVEIAGIEHLAMIDALQKTLEALRTTLEFEVKSVASERFTSYVAATGQKPENFTATEGGATASMQFRRKSSAYALSEETVTLLRAHDIEPEKVVSTPALFAINPSYAGDEVLLAKVEKALKKIVPEDFIVAQEEQSKLVATEATLDAAIRAKAPAAVLQALTTISCGPKLRETNLQQILEFVGGLIDAPVFGAAAEQVRLRVVQ